MKVNSITSIKKKNNEGEEICLEEGTDYRFDEDLGTIYWIGNSERATDGYCFIDIEANIGWECTDLPTNLKMAIVELTSLHYDMREIDVPIPAKVLNILAKYRYMA